jgi:hypothetical protein
LIYESEEYHANMAPEGMAAVMDAHGAFSKAVDARRREGTLRRKLPLLVEPVEADATGRSAAARADGGVPDDRLRLVIHLLPPDAVNTPTG